MTETTESYEPALAYGQQAVRAGQAALGAAPAQARPRGSLQIVISAGGFPGYPDDDSEIRRLEAHHWMPTTVDFQETGRLSRGRHFSAVDAGQFFGPLAAAASAISRIAFVGHGSSQGLGLSGDSTGTFTRYLAASNLPEWQQTIDERVKPKLGSDCVLDIYACRAGAGEPFMKALAQALGICVRGFREEIAWCVNWDTSARRITSRGRIAPRSAVAPDKLDCSKAPWRAGVDGFVPPVPVCP